MSRPLRVPSRELSYEMNTPPGGNSLGSLHSSFITCVQTPGWAAVRGGDTQLCAWLCAARGVLGWER
jgi:hypothetical protein